MSNKNSGIYTRSFDQVITAEHGYIRERGKQGHSSPFDNLERDSEQLETSGLALSGGGIRSAAFCLGVLQYLSKKKILGKFDYLSTVSGGGYIGSALTWFLNKPQHEHEPDYDLGKNFPFGNEQDLPVNSAPGDQSAQPYPATRLLNYLINNGNYLTGGRNSDYILLIIEACKALFSNILVWTALLVGTLLFLTGLASFINGDYATLSSVSRNAIVPKLDWLLWLSLVVIFFIGVTISVYSYLYSKNTRTEKNYSHLTNSLRAQLNKLLKFASLFFVGIFLLRLWLIWDGTINSHVVAGSVIPLLASMVLREYKKHLTWLAPLIAFLSLFVFFMGIIWLYEFAIQQALHILDPEKFIQFLLRFGFILVVFGVLLGIFKNINLTSFGSYYRDSLMRLFMPSEDSISRHMPVHSQTADDFSIHRCKKGPLHLINTFVILPDAGSSYASKKKKKNKIHPEAVPSSQAFEKVRKYNGDNFILSPVYCGSEYLGWEKSEEYMNQKMALPTAMAISAAAANPHGSANGKGFLTGRLVALAMGIYNIRLGYWAPNPMNRGKIYGRISKILRKQFGYVPNHFSPGFREIFSYFSQFLPGINHGLDEMSHYVQLSDGAHFANLGLYELFRRKCRIILCCDAAADPHYQFADLNNELTRAKEDFGLLLDMSTIQLDPIMPREKRNQGYPHQTSFSEDAFVHIKFSYPQTDGQPRVKGDLIILKTALIKEADFFIRAYESVQADFPDQTTADQFFDKEQFEAYRRLGYTIANDTLSEEKFMDLLQESEQLDAKFSEVDAPETLGETLNEIVTQQKDKLAESIDQVATKIKKRETVRMLLDIDKDL